MKELDEEAVVKKEAQFEELQEKRKINDWNDTEVGEESEMDSQYDFPECRTSPTAPRWLDEQTEMPDDWNDTEDEEECSSECSSDFPVTPR